MLFADTGIMEIVYPTIRKAHLMSTMGDVRAILDGITMQSLIHIRLYLIVAIYKSDPLPGCFRNAPETGGSNTTVFLVNDMQIGMCSRIPIQDFSGIIRGTVIHCNDLDVGICLCKNAVKASWQIRSDIIYGHDYADLVCHDIISFL
jgi:hypothetical protein